MITQFKIFESEDKVGVAWVNPRIRDILIKYNMDIKFENDNTQTIYFRKSKETITQIIHGVDLSDLFDAIKNLLWRLEITEAKCTEIIDKICEFQIKQVNPGIYPRIEKYISEKLKKKLEGNPKYGHLISSGKFGI